MNDADRRRCAAIIAFSNSPRGQLLKQQHAERGECLAKRNDELRERSRTLIEKARELDKRIARLEKTAVPPRAYLLPGSIGPVPGNVVEAIEAVQLHNGFSKIT